MIISIIAMITSLLVLACCQGFPTLGITCGATLTLAYFIISLRISAQRLHDINWSAWMLLLHLVPVANLVLSLMMLLMPGTPAQINIMARRHRPTAGPSTCWRQSRSF